MAGLEFLSLQKKTPSAPMSRDEQLLRQYLEEKAPIAYSDHALEATVQDVLSMDDDLKQYVMIFLQTGITDTEIQCECANIPQLLRTQQFTPVTAALFIQWYRRDPVGAAGFLLHHDSITQIPDELPKMEE